jgi:hypothetical protein
MLDFDGARVRPLWALPVRLASALSVNAYVRCAYRIRGWGTLPRYDSPALIISNHQIDLDLMGVISEMGVRGGWKAPLFAAAAKLLHEPGFLALRVPWFAPLCRSANAGWLFGGMGLLPIENQIRTRSLARWAYAVQRLHGVLPLEEVFMPATLERYALAGLRTRDLFGARHFALAQQPARLSDLQPQHRREQFEITARGIEEDLARIERYVRKGATFYVTPEGEYSHDGAMLPFRGIWARLRGLAKNIYLAGISYDPFAPGRLSQLYRVVELQDRENVVSEIKAARPVTTSALLSAWLMRAPRQFSIEDAIGGTTSVFAELPSSLFVDPEFVCDRALHIERAIGNMERTGLLGRGRTRYMLNATRRHPAFPNVEDIVAFQASFLAESIEGAAALGLRTEARAQSGEIDYRATPSRLSMSR